MLENWLKGDPDRDTDWSAEEARALEELDPATRQQLEVLGYIQAPGSGKRKSPQK
jgi:hypothetical protein